MTCIREEEECAAAPAGALLLVYSLYPCFVLQPLHNFRPGTECINNFWRVTCFCVSWVVIMAGSLIVLGWQWNWWLLQVTLGKCHELLDANADAHKLPSGYHSVKGLGKLAPNSADNRILYVYVFHTFSIVVALLHVTYITYDQLPLMLIFVFCCLWLLMCTQGHYSIALIRFLTR